MDYLFKNGYMPFEDEIKDLYVKDGVIDKIADHLEIEAEQVINLEGKILFNGFVDSHMHLDKALISEKIVNQSGSLTEAIEIMGEYKKSMTKEDIKERARKIIDQSFANGSRYLRTHIDVDDIIGLKGIEAIHELREEYKEKMAIQIVAFPQEGFLDHMENYDYLKKSLELEVDAIGGIPATENNPKAHIDKIFDLALERNLDIDMHIDETDDPDSLTIDYLAKKTIEHDYQGKVVAGHLCSLAANELEEIEAILDRIKEAEIDVITLPSTNLYLQAREDTKNFRRGITRVKDLLDRDVHVSIGSDNIQDPFNPFGNSNMLEEALVSAHGLHMGGAEDLEKVFDMISIHPARLFSDYDLKEGQQAQFIVLNTDKKYKAIIEQAEIMGYFNKEAKKWNY